MGLKSSLLFFCLMLAAVGVRAQCECTDCPVNTISNATVTSVLNISGSTNDQLGSNGQAVCQICIEMVHDAIDEMEFWLITPSGTSIQLIDNSGLSVNDNINFNICFLSCDQTAVPDPGFPPVFDSGAGWLPGGNYTGSYYPFDGCLENLTGDVNGNWTLEMTDFVGLDDGTIFNWYLVFADDAGIGCQNAGACGPPCLADAGQIPVPPDTNCVGDPSLATSSFAPFYDGVTFIEPPAADYGLTFVVYSTAIVNSPIIEITPTPDLTGYPPGTYAICAYSYLLSDAPLIPIPDGMLSAADLQQQIADGDICADLMNICWIRTIVQPPEIPDFTGPVEVCAGTPVQYVINNVVPGVFVTFAVVQGSFSQFGINNDTLNVTWNPGPAQICAQFENYCGFEETCLVIDVLTDSEIMISGNQNVCPGASETYTITPDPSPSTSYVHSVLNGTVIGQTDNTVTILWDPDADMGELCVDLTGSNCPPDTECIPITINQEDNLPDLITMPAEICQGESFAASIPFDPAILFFLWTETGLMINSGQGTDQVTFTALDIGTATVCLDITNQCGDQGPLCQDIEVLENPTPATVPLDPTCDLSFTLEAVPSIGSGIWSQTGGPAGASIDNPTSPVTGVTVNGPGTYTFTYTETNLDCEETAVVTVEVLSDLLVSDPIFDCDTDGAFTVQFDILSGTEPYFVDGVEIIGATYLSGSFLSGDTYSFLIEDMLGCSTMVEGQYECPCLSDAGTMSSSILEVCGTSGEVVIAESNGDFILDGNDTLYYILHDNAGNSLGNIFGENTTGVFSIAPGMVFGEVYYISVVVGNESGGIIDFGDPCLSVAAGQPVIFYDDPSVTLLGPGLTCIEVFQLGGTLSDDVTQTTWSLISGPGSAFFNTSFSFPTTVVVDNPGLYTFELIASNGFCSVASEIDVEMLSGPVIINPEEICDNTSTSFVLIFEVEGTGPFSADLPGTFNGTVFTSDPIPSGQFYEVVVTDANGCQSLPLLGSKLCDCTTSAGTMDGNLIELCDTIAPAQALYFDDAELDDDDTLFYYLHTSPSNVLESIIDFNIDGIFFFQDGMVPGVTYYISVAAGNASGDSIDLLDACLDVAAGQPVVWYLPPQTSAGPPETVCLDTEFFLNANPSSGFWTVVSAPIVSEITITNAADPQTGIFIGQPGVYGLSWTSINGTCQVSDTTLVTAVDNAIVSNAETTCSDDLQFYTVSFDFAGSDPPYLVNGIAADSSFTSGLIPVDSMATFLIESASGCLTEYVSGPVNCDCISDAGSVMVSDIELCADQPLDLLFSNNDFVLDPNDTLAYVVHDGSASPLGSVLWTSYGEPISFNPVFAFNTPYFINVVVGNVSGGQIQLDDPCLSVSESLTLTWLPVNDIDIDTTVMVCRGDTAFIEISATGNLPVDITLQNENFETIPVSLTAPITSVAIPVDGNSVWSIASATGTCIHGFIGLTVIEVQEPEVVTFQSGTTLCNTTAFGSSIAIADLVVGVIPPGIWNSEDLLVSGDSIYAAGLPAGTYTVTYSTIGFEGVCAGSEFSVQIEVVDCDCPLLNLPGQIATCNTHDPIDLSLFNFQSINGEWIIQNPDFHPNPPIISDQSLLVNGADGGMYLLEFFLSDSVPPGCAQQFTTPLVIESQLLAGTGPGVNITFCASQDTLITLSDLLTGADPGGQWIRAGSPSAEMFGLAELEIGTNRFVYLIQGTDKCLADSSEVIIEVIPDPIFEFLAEHVTCFGANDGEIIIDIQNQGDGPFICFVNNEIVGDKEVNGLAPGSYSIAVENIGGCRTEMTAIEITEPDPITVFLGDDRQVQINEEVLIEAIASISISDIGALQWEDLAGTLNEEDLTLLRSFANDNVISIFIEDENGCLASDEINIRITDQNIYIPNVFNPLSDGPNSRFGPIGDASQTVESFQIYDRWGELVFSRSNVVLNTPDAFWDGTLAGENLMPGVYVYSIRILNSRGDTEVFKGDVTLIR